MTILDDADRGVDAVDRASASVPRTDTGELPVLEPVETPSEPTGFDRRGTSAGPRMSWARSRPFEDRPPRAVERPDAGWQVEASAYVLRVVAVDLMVAGVVVGAIAWLTRPGSAIGMLWTLGVVVTFLASMALFRGYDTNFLGTGPGEFQAVLRGGLAAVVVPAVVSEWAGLPMSRSVVATTAVLLTLGVGVGRYGVRRGLHRARAQGQAMARTLIVGDGAGLRRVVDDLQTASYHGYRVVGTCVPSLDTAPTVRDVPTLGAIADIPQVVHDWSIDVVVVTGGALTGDGLRRLSWALEQTGTRLVVAPGLVEVMGSRVRMRPTAGLSLLEVEVATPRRRQWAKWWFDRLTAAMMLLVAGPVIAVCAVAVALTSKGSPFFVQQRVGIDGVPFRMFKLRSMYVDAEARKAALAAQDEGNGVLFKMRADPRVTPVGRVLRRLSLDELPQLWNVLRGDMSLVGPRPPLPDEVDGYRDATWRRLHVRPGLTGLWQVSGRSDLSWDESIRLDLRYVDNWSIALDLLIVWKTLRAVIGGSGAY
ncbi:sugar transferase [Cellulomonas citrea]|uniref:sugar transferase n=1 Tax=Cellulomonas citrea TaxID=1909423 RepID=UPI00135BD0B2|nr:sugar transferase [Cellulomonas citrea]